MPGGFHGRLKSFTKNMEVLKAPLGVIIKGVDLNGDISQELIQQFKTDVHKYRLLIFKEQGKVNGKTHVEISKWFGEFESTFYKHPKSPDPDIFRVSNVREEGCTNVGRTGWHIDGSFMEKPFGFSLYHMVSVPKKGNTDFVPLYELLESLPAETRARWERLWMLPDRRDKILHPLVYPHPVTNLPTMCFHLGMTAAYVWDYGTDKQRVTSPEETVKIHEEIHNEIVKDNKKLIYSHKWEEGDFIISDNLSVGHEATPETQYPVEEVGLRILHRTTIKGTSKPQKTKTA